MREADMEEQIMVDPERILEQININKRNRRVCELHDISNKPPTLTDVGGLELRVQELENRLAEVESKLKSFGDDTP